MVPPLVFLLVILKRNLRFNLSGFFPGFSKATFCGSCHVPRDASSVADPGFSSGPAASVKQTDTKMPLFQVPSSGNDSVERAKLQNPLYQRTLKEDPHFETQVKALERMLKVRERVVESDAAVSAVPSGKGDVGLDPVTDLLKVSSGAGYHASGADGRPTSSLRVAGFPARLDGVHTVAEFGIISSGQPALASAGELRNSTALLVDSGSVAEPVMGSTADAVLGEFKETIGFLVDSESVAEPVRGSTAAAVPGATRAASQTFVSLIERYESDFPPLRSSGCLSVPACASVPAVLGVSARVCPVPSFSAVSAAVAHARLTPMHDAHNSCFSTVVNSLRTQRSTSYNPEGVVAHNSRRKVRSNRTVGNRSVVQTVDMSPALAAGTYRRSADEVHGQRQISRSSRAESARGNPGPGPGPGGRSGFGGGVSGHAAAFMEIPCSLVMPPGRHQFEKQSLGWARVCGSGKSGVWVLKGDARTYNLPWNLDDVGIVWERRSGYETAWATPRHVCSCSYGYGHGPVLPQANPSVFTEAVNLWSRVASLLTPWCVKGEVPTGVNLNRYAGNGSRIPWHCDNERLFGSPFEPKVIVSMSLGHSVLFKLRRRASKNSPSQTQLDHGDLLVMDGLTQLEYEHSTASELERPRENLMYRWISQHIRSCPLAGLICGALPSEAQDLAEPHSRGGGSRKSK